MRGVLGQTVIEFRWPTPSAADALARTEAFAKEFDHDELITPSIAPHSVYTLDATTLTAVSALARKLMIPIQIHLAETQAEIGLSQERHKMRPVAILESLNFWAPTTLAAHGVWINDDEVALLKRRDVGVSNNPESNMKPRAVLRPVMSKYRNRRVERRIAPTAPPANNA